MAKVKVELDRESIGRLLKSDDVANFLENIGNEIVGHAGSGYEVNINQTRRKSRVIVEVIDPRPDAKWREAKTGNLARAVGATSL